MPETLVIDCSVAAKWVLPEPHREPAIRVLQQWESGEITLIAPDLLLAELASLLAKRSRRKQLSTGQAKQAFDLMKRATPAGMPPSGCWGKQLGVEPPLRLNKSKADCGAAWRKERWLLQPAFRLRGALAPHLGSQPCQRTSDSPH